MSQNQIQPNSSTFMLVLFIDDDPQDFETFCDAIKGINKKAHCIYAKDGEVGIRILNELTILPDYIFLDINMPIMGGAECLVLLKEDERLKYIPVIMYSTLSDQKEIDRFRKLGAQFITKPSSYEGITRAIKPYFA